MQYIHKPPDGKQEERSNFHRKKKFANQKVQKKIKNIRENENHVEFSSANNKTYCFWKVCYILRPRGPECSFNSSHCSGLISGVDPSRKVRPLETLTWTQQKNKTKKKRCSPKLARLIPVLGILVSG